MMVFRYKEMCKEISKQSTQRISKNGDIIVLKCLCIFYDKSNI